MSQQSKNVKFLGLAASLLILAGHGKALADDPIEPDQATVRAFANAPDKAPVFMLNLLKFKPKGGREAYGRYSLVAVAHVIRRGGQLAFIGKAAPSEDMPNDWDAIGIVRYPSRQTFVDMVTDPTYQIALPNRRKGLERTVLYPFVVSESTPSSSARTSAQERQPPASQDQALVILTLVKFKADDRRKSSAPSVTDQAKKHDGEILLDLMADRPLISDKTWDRMLLVKYRSRQAYLDSQKMNPELRAATAARENSVERSVTYAFTPGQ